jgi:hypothetical protein
VRGGTGLHANEARRQSFEELHHLTAAKLLPDDDLLGRIDAVDLKHVLGDIQTDCGNLHVERLPDVVCSNDHLTAIRRRERAPSTTSSSDLVSVDWVSVNGFADTEGDQNQRSCHQHPTGMEAARPPKVTESAKQVEAADEYAGREPCVRL